jgi:PAS domain S-box-containing protein
MPIRGIYSDLIDAVPVGLAITTPSGKILEANPAFLDMLGGYTREELISMDVSDLYADLEDREKILEAIKEGPVHFYETQFKRRDGSRFWISISTTLITTPGGRRYIMSSFEDVSEMRAVEKELADEKEFIDTALDSLQDGFYVLSGKGGRLLRWNNLFRELGYSDEELSGMTVFDFFDEEGKTRQWDFFAEMVETGKGILDIDVVLKDGRRLPVQCQSTLIRDENGEPDYVVGVARDMTERRAYEERLRKTNAELKGFSRTVSHDLRRPLVGIKLAAETLVRVLAEEEGEQKLSSAVDIAMSIEKAVDRASSFIEDLLALAEAGATPSDVSIVEVEAVVESILEESAEAIKERGIDVKVGRGLGALTANPTHIYQLFDNLIGNAIKHNDSARPAIQIKKLADDKASRHRYRVCDNGSGIPAEDLENVFVPFFKGDTGETGIGLSTVEKIVKSYGGWIKAYNKGGACFEFAIKDAKPPAETPPDRS